MKTKNKISRTFLGFLLASILIWFLITLSKEYVITINFPINYTGISKDKILQSTPQKDLNLVVKASGFKILKTRLNTKKIAINSAKLNRKKGTKYFVLPRTQKASVQQQLPSGVDLQEIIKDTLYLDLGSLVTKKVVIKPNVDLKYHVGYDLSEKIKIQPDSVLVYGPENYIKTLQNVEMNPLVLTDLKNDFEKSVALKKPKDIKNLKFSKQKVIVTGKVEKFTEGTLIVPYNIINVPENLTINTLSKKVSVVFIVGLSHFNKINANSFQIVCDYNTTQKNNLNYLIPKVISKPEIIKSYKLVPNKIDYLIEK
ncbi:CdaR family protein [Polaribacter sp.]|uniref:CdaR family protein n=1 Tax=Polaribacter sp. TaxID=1920175 RepID=UPI003F6A6BD0